MAEHPELLEAQKTKDEKLHGYLKEVYVKSTDNFEQSNTSTKSLPLNRIPPPEPDMGSLEHISGKISEGRVTLKTVFSFLGQHRSDPQNFSIQKIAKDNKLDEKDVENVLNFFKILHLYIPKEMYEKNKKMKKYVAEQFKLSSSAASPPFVLSDKTQKKDDKEKPQDFSPTKT
uniref:Uncharacterized protein n=1 Tax=Arion vulgaris TaxID=1028688 RepID=A0A0B7A1W9_9EUPU